MASEEQETKGIVNPHEHDVLSGRGNFVNYHAGNEYFRELVRKHKVEYVKCPKPQKGKFSKLIVDEIKNRNPPGRFLKQDGSTKLWYDIGEKKALDKTRQALREGAPELAKEITGEDSDNEDKYRSMRNSIGGAAALSSDLQQLYMSAGMNLQSPLMGQRNHLGLTSPPLASPQLLSPGLLMNAQLSPEMQQLSATRQTQFDASNRMSQFIGSQVIPPPQVHRQDEPNMSQLNQAQQQMLLNEYMMNQRSALNNQGGLSEEQIMLQNKLAAMYSTNQLEPRPLAVAPGEMPRPKNDQFQQPKSETPPDQNPRRMPPPSLLKRDESLKMEKIFGISPGAGSVKKKYDANSSNISAMSMSLGDMQFEGNLSSVFDSSLRISPAVQKPPVMAKDKQKPDKPPFGGENFDMSVATLGLSEANMSFATLGDPKLHESEGNMSFSRVFEDADKLG